MTLITTIPVICAIIGLCIYFMTSHKNLGLVVLGCGLLPVMLKLASKMVDL